MRKRGAELPTKSGWEILRFEVNGSVGIIYRSGKVVYHEPLADLIESALIEEPGIEIGSDEVGKGEDVGPIVVSAVALDDKGRKHLRARGLLESKSLPKGRISEIAKLVEELSLASETLVIGTDEFRKVWTRGNLNRLLASWHSAVIESVIERIGAAKRVIVDSFDERVIMEQLRWLEGRVEEIVVEKEADKRYASVAAASLIAKRTYYLALSRDRGKKWDASG